MKGYKKSFGRVDVQVIGILCGFHTLWLVLAGICAKSNGYGEQILGDFAVLWIVMCGVSVAVSVWTFRRISNPGKRELWSMDLLTGLKNRNAFEVDIHNLENMKRGCSVGIIVVDLDHLKKINDAQGHAMGDVYIYDAAKCIREELEGNAVAYRIGGDEFAVIIQNSKGWEIENLILRIQKRFELEYKQELGEELFLSAGYAIYNPGGAKKFVEALVEADENMYKEKRSREEKIIQKLTL